MGFYIETGKNFGKAEYLIQHHGAQPLAAPPAWSDIPEGKCVVCVVANPAFEAAAYAFDANELNRFANPADRRPRRWLLMNTALVRTLVGLK